MTFVPVAIFVLGLVAIGVVFLLLAKGITVKTTKDAHSQQVVIAWGVFMAVIWIIVGTLCLAAFYHHTLGS